MKNDMLKMDVEKLPLKYYLDVYPVLDEYPTFDDFLFEYLSCGKFKVEFDYEYIKSVISAHMVANGYRDFARYWRRKGVFDLDNDTMICKVLKNPWGFDD